MNVILKNDVEKLGYKDDLVKVKNGFARNFLIPRGLAITANETNLKIHQENLKQAKSKHDKIKKEAQRIADELSSKTILLGTKASETGKIFGSITPLQIAEKLKELGFTIDRKRIKVPTGIKELGDYTAKVDLHKEIHIELKIKVFAE